MQPVQRRRYACHRAVRQGRLMRLALPLQQVGAKDERYQLGGVERKRALDRGFLTPFVLQLPAGQREIDPLLGLRSVAVDEALERGAGLLQVSFAEGPQPECGQSSRMAGVDFEDSTP